MVHEIFREWVGCVKNWIKIVRPRPPKAESDFLDA